MPQKRTTTEHIPRRVVFSAAALVLCACLLGGCKFFAPTKLAEETLNPVKLATEPLDTSHLMPSNYRDWEPDQVVLPYAKFNDDKVTVYNIRNTIYRSEDNYAVRHEKRTYDLNELDSVDYIVVPFQAAPSLAHTMLSFGFGGEEYLALSVEVRKEKDEVYSPLQGLLGQYELMYVVADERDVIGLRTNHRKDDVYIYRTKATPEQARALFVDVFQRVNKLRAEPEFYHTITNNCTTNIATHVNRLVPNRIPGDPRLLFSGQSDRMAYELGLLDTDESFEETKQRAQVTELARRYADRPDFSVKIRQR